MTDERTHKGRLQQGAPPSGVSAYLHPKDSAVDGAEGCCKAFGYLRGLRSSASSLEFRFRSGNSVWFPYGWMGPWQYNPSEGLLLKFSGDLVYLVLIRGSNLAKPLSEGTINLTHAGLQRQRVLWLREMTHDEILQVGETGPTIDSIEIAEFESREELREWLARRAPAFLPGPAE
jgi:hypothetical protein